MNKTISVFTVASLLVTFSLLSQNTDQLPFDEDVESEQLEPIFLPSKNLQVLDFEIIESIKDGLVSRELKLTGKDSVLTSIPLRNWNYQSSTPLNCSLLFKYRYDPSTKIEISVFSSSRIGGKLDSDTAQRLLAGVESLPYQRLNLVVAHSNIRPSGYLGNLLGKPSFFFDYEYLSEEQILIREQLFLMQHKNEIVTAKLSGPAETIEQQNQSLIMFVHNLSVSQ